MDRRKCDNSGTPCVCTRARYGRGVGTTTCCGRTDHRWRCTLRRGSPRGIGIDWLSRISISFFGQKIDRAGGGRQLSASKSRNTLRIIRSRTYAGKLLLHTDANREFPRGIHFLFSLSALSSALLSSSLLLPPTLVFISSKKSQFATISDNTHRARRVSFQQIAFARKSTAAAIRSGCRPAGNIKLAQNAFFFILIKVVCEFVNICCWDIHGDGGRRL